MLSDEIVEKLWFSINRKKFILINNIYSIMVYDNIMIDCYINYKRKS